MTRVFLLDAPPCHQRVSALGLTYPTVDVKISLTIKEDWTMAGINGTDYAYYADLAEKRADELGYTR